MVNLVHSFFFYFWRTAFAFRFYFYQLTLFFNQENQETGCQIMTKFDACNRFPVIIILRKTSLCHTSLSRFIGQAGETRKAAG